MKNIIVTLLCILTLSACNSVSKKCSNGVCTIEENGVRHYEGDADKVAALQQRDAAVNEQEAELQKAYDSAPRRAKNENVSVGLVIMKPASSELSAFHEAYANMILEEGRKIGLTLVEPKQMNQAVNLAGSSSKGLEVGPLLARKIRMLGAKPDVVSYISIGTKTKTGILKGSGTKGAAIAQAQVPEFQAKVTSAFNYQPKEFSFQGKSLTNLDLAGVNAAGKSGTMSLKSTRKIETDRPAVQQLMQELKKTVALITPTLPSATAVVEIEKARPGVADPRAQATDDLKNKLKDLFKK